MQMGFVFSIFTLAYGAFEIPTGWWGDRIGTRRGFILSITVWSLAAMAHAFARGEASLSACRFVLGLDEAGNWPGAAKAIAEWFPIRQRAFAMAIFNSGAALGSVVAPPLIVFLALQYGWEAMERFLAGARAVDRHFIESPLQASLPAMLGLFGVWNATFRGHSTRALLPYCQALLKLAPHVQQVDMESNGKRVALDGSTLDFDAGEIDFVPLDGPGTIQAFLAGEGDVAMAWSPPSVSLITDPEQRFESVCSAERSGNKIYSLYMVHPDYWDSDPDDAAKWLSAVYRANEWINENPDEALAYMLEFYDDIGNEGGEVSAQIELDRRNFYSLDQAITAFTDGEFEDVVGIMANFFVDAGAWSEMPDVAAIAAAGRQVAEAASNTR